MANLDVENQRETFSSISYIRSSLSESLKLIASLDFQSKIRNTEIVHSISFKINEGITTKLNETSFAHFFDSNHSVLISFESTVGKKDSKIFWKLSGNEKFYYLELVRHCNELLTEFCGRFLVDEIRKGKSGILKCSQSKEIIEIHDIGNEDDQNLLIIAALENNNEIVEKLLEFKLNFERGDNEGHCAIDKAWLAFLNSEDAVNKEKSDQIILMLLKSSSPLPAEDLGFEYDKASKDVQEFISMCEKIHKDVESGYYKSLEEQLKLNSNLRQVYDREGISLVSNPCICKNAKKLNYLFSRGLSPAYYEDIEDIYSNIDPKYHKMIRKNHENSAKQMPKVHLSILKQKSKIGGNDWKHDERWKYVEDAFEILNQNKIASKILKVVAAWNNLQIIFDFKQDTVYYLDPTKSEFTRGTTYNTGKIYIGAQYLMNHEKKFSVIGVLIHELCHFAVLITFMNNFDPYPMGESEVKKRFDRIVTNECERNKEFESLVSNVYSSYEIAHQHSELIVLVVQMLMHYYIKDPKIKCENSNKIDEIQQKYGELFKYFKEIVEPELEKAVKIIKLLQDTSQKIEFKKLTEPMKAKVLHSRINFQEEETTLFELIGNDLEVLNSIPSEFLHKMLIEDKKINISEIYKKSVKYKIIERRFTSQTHPLRYFNNPSWGKADNSGNEFKQITDIAKNLKMFILSDTAGAGKTTTFIDLTKKLKKEFKTHWVVYIKLRAYDKVFEEYQEFEQNLSKEKVFELFLNILKLNSELETKIFTKLFNDNKAILLFDGIDEICPTFNQLIIEIIDVLKQSTENQLWISTRPQHATQFDRKFNIPIYKFVPYTENDIEEFIAEILKVLLPNKEDKQNEELQFLKTFLKSIEENFSSNDYNVNNPLMIEVITELHVGKKINLHSTNLNIFGVFEQIVDKQIEKIDEKIQKEDRIFFLKTSIKTVHQVFAIKFLFKNEQDLEELNNLTIFKNWRKVQDKWTSEKIQRYGFMTVDLNDQSYIDFTHRTYAEFFLTEFIISHIFDDSLILTNEERETIYRLFQRILNQRFFYGFIFALLLSYIKNSTENNSLVLPDLVKKLIIKEIPNIRNEVIKLYNVDESDDEEPKTASKFSGFIRKIKSKKLKDFKIFKVFKNLFSSKKNLNTDDDYCDVDDDDLYPFDSDDEDIDDNFYYNEDSSEIGLEVESDSNYKQNMKSKNIAIMNIKYLELFSYILKPESQNVNKLWMINKSENLLYKIINCNLLCNFETLKSILEILEYAFGSHFHRILSKKVKNIITDDDINNLIKGIQISNLSRNLLKLLDLIQKNYKIDMIKSINSKILHECMVLDHVENEIQMTIFLDISEVFRTNQKEFINFLILSTQTSSMNVCKYIGDNIEELLKKDKNDIKTFLYYKYSEENHPLIKSLLSNRADIFHKYKELFTKYKTSDDEIQAIFISSCDLSYLFFTMNDETYQEFKNFIGNIFSTNKDLIFNFPEYRNIRSKGISKAFELFEDFASSFFDNDTENSKKLANKLFPFSYYQDNHPLIDSAKSDSEEMFVTCKKIFTKYLCSIEELQNIFVNYCYIPEILLCIRPPIVSEFKNLVKDVFISNKELISTCLRDGTEMTTRTMIRRNVYTEAISFSVYDENTNKLRKIQRITMFNVNGYRDTEENQKYWIKSELLSIHNKIKLFKDLVLFLYENDKVTGWALIKATLFQTRQIWDYLFLRCINTNYWLKIETITNIQKLEHFEEISLCYCAGDVTETRNFVRKMLFFNNNPDYHSFHRVIKLECLEKFKIFKNFYVKYKNSWEELQNIFISFCDLTRIFSEITDEIYNEFKDLLLKTFKTNQIKIFECFDKNSWMYYQPVNTIRMFENLENLSSVIFINDKVIYKEFMRQIVFHKYWIRYHPLIQSTLLNSIDEFMFYKSLCIKYMNSKEEIQDYLLKWNYIPHVLLQAEPKIYSEFMLFIKEIFNSDIQKIDNFSTNLIEKNNNSLNIDECLLFVQGIQSYIFD